MKENIDSKEKTLHIKAGNTDCINLNNKLINHKNSKYCTYKGECYQTIACRAGGKKLCTHFVNK